MSDMPLADADLVRAFFSSVPEHLRTQRDETLFVDLHRRLADSQSLELSALERARIRIALRTASLAESDMTIHWMFPLLTVED